VIEDPAPNTIARPYRGLSVQEVGMPLTEPGLMPFLLGRLAEQVVRQTGLVGRTRSGTAMRR
jgi:hypothetical protein